MSFVSKLDKFLYFLFLLCLVQTLQSGFSRCVSVLSSSSKQDEMAVEVCTHICRCFRVSAQFESCREAIIEVPAIIKDVCRVLYYKVCGCGFKDSTFFN